MENVPGDEDGAADLVRPVLAIKVLKRRSLIVYNLETFNDINDTTNTTVSQKRFQLRQSESFLCRPVLKTGLPDRQEA